MLLSSSILSDYLARYTIERKGNKWMECTGGVDRMTQCSWKILLLEPLSQRWWQKLAAVVSIEGERRQLYRTTSVIFPNSTVHPNLLSLTSNTGRMKFRKQWQSVHVCCFGHERCCMTVAWTPENCVSFLGNLSEYFNKCCVGSIWQIAKVWLTDASGLMSARIFLKFSSAFMKKKKKLECFTWSSPTLDLRMQHLKALKKQLITFE